MAKDYISVALRRLVFERARCYCEYCRSPGQFALESMEVEHTIPSSRGGETVASNLALACHGCNQHKGTRTEGFDQISSTTVPLYNPRQMRWDEHFIWAEEARLIIGTTPTGRVTVEMLKLNRTGVVNLRRVLVNSGEHPPTF
jgi:hypothetical protein